MKKNVIKKTIHLNETEIRNLKHFFDVKKIIRNKNSDNIELIIRNNGQWGIEKP